MVPRAYASAGKNADESRAKKAGSNARAQPPAHGVI
jgi:hypothetical protein